MINDKFHYMEKALELAREAEQKDEVPVGAIIVYDGEIIGRGFNRVISDSDPTAHAEMVALRDAGKKIGNYRLIDAEVYVTLEPCLMCYSALVHARVKRLIFGAFDEKTGVFSGNKFDSMNNIYNHTIEMVSGVLREESSELLKNFFRKKRQKN